MSDEEYTLDEWCDGLVAFAEHLRERGEALFTMKSSFTGEGRLDLPEPVTVSVWCGGPEELAVKVSLVGAGEKYSDQHETYSTTGVRRRFGPHLLDVYAPSNAVCTPARRETRLNPVVRLTDEAKAEIEAIRARHTVNESKEVVTEWRCPPSLLAARPGQHEEESE